MSKKQKMDLTEKLENIHGGNLIVQDGTTKLRSIFDFVKYEELFAFVEGCKLANSILIFENEGLTIKPTLPLGNNFSIYGEVGLGTITRNGFEDANNNPIVKVAPNTAPLELRMISPKPGMVR